MVSNAQLEREKQCYSYQIETLKDEIQELEECYYKLQRDYKDKSRNYELLNRDFAKLNDENLCLKECLKHRDQVIKESGLVLLSSQNGLDDDFSKCVNGETSSSFFSNQALITQETISLLNEIEGETIENKLKLILNETQDLRDEVKYLKTELQRERERNQELVFSEQMVNGTEGKSSDVETNRLINDYKFQLLESEKERNNLQNTVNRLETQIERMKINVEDLERSENDLRIEKRKIARELREAQGRLEELEASNNHLQKRIDKLMSSRLANINSE
ncbi:leucine-rich repeat flightless-interacting protein 2-like protein [Dinothrombium tinctorium]|uniref:Leucine-rich repeat flightless-interacting protein 2-like protein n=1 Tax=Dinothrombium tinctorium TaxID=1965070 RepID=A0A443RM19_9ACAR|nr:leucine-rich repeat flightless-interacting protein 2-like protein [Dinothrombium tinctorium]